VDTILLEADGCGSFTLRPQGWDVGTVKFVGRIEELIRAGLAPLARRFMMLFPVVVVICVFTIVSVFPDRAQN
jgi:hypothetical protein